MKHNVQIVAVVMVDGECTGGGDGGGCTSHALKHFLFGSSMRPNYPILVSLTSQPSYRMVVISGTYLYDKTETFYATDNFFFLLFYWSTRGRVESIEYFTKHTGECQNCRKHGCCYTDVNKVTSGHLAVNYENSGPCLDEPTELEALDFVRCIRNPLKRGP